MKLENKNLKQFRFEFVASSNVTEIRFSDVDETKRTYGILMDDIKVVMID